MKVNDLYSIAGRYRIVDALTLETMFVYDGTSAGDIPPDIASREVHRFYAKNNEIIVEVL